MPRRLKIKAKDIQRSRRDWYSFHFEKRQKFLALPPPTQNIYKYGAEVAPRPIMTIYGGLPGDHPSGEDIRRLMCIVGMQDVDLANYWYVSDQGWADFQRLWADLPEPVDIYDNLSTDPCVQIGDVVLSVHKPDEVTPSFRDQSQDVHIHG